MDSKSSPMPWLEMPKFTREPNEYAIMGQDGGLIAIFYDCMGRGEANRDLCLRAIGAYYEEYGRDGVAEAPQA
jgi:hypothetical protein